MKQNRNARRVAGDHAVRAAVPGIRTGSVSKSHLGGRSSQLKAED